MRKTFDVQRDLCLEKTGIVYLSFGDCSKQDPYQIKAFNKYGTVQQALEINGHLALYEIVLPSPYIHNQCAGGALGRSPQKFVK